jgi:hypothetical protein
MHYEPPSAEQIEALKKELGMDGNQIADLFGVADRRAFRRYTSKSPIEKNRREISAYMLFFAMARLELDKETTDRILDRMRKVGAVIDLASTGDSSQD